MAENFLFEAFFAQYDKQVLEYALNLRKVLLENLPHILEQIDYKAKMVAYCYGQKYVDLICVIIPSKKGLKLGFNRGVELSDPFNLLEGKAKISRYINIKSVEQIKSPELLDTLQNAMLLYMQIENSLPTSFK